MFHAPLFFEFLCNRLKMQSGDTFYFSLFWLSRTVLHLSNAEKDSSVAGTGATLNHSSNTIQQEITWPLRLIYYVHDDNESTYHILDTKAKNQQKDDQVNDPKRTKQATRLLHCPLPHPPIVFLLLYSLWMLDFTYCVGAERYAVKACDFMLHFHPCGLVAL